VCENPSRTSRRTAILRSSAKYEDLADALVELGDSAAAEAALLEVIRIVPGFTYGYVSLANLLQERDDGVGAADILRKGIDNFPESGNLLELGRMFTDLGHVLDANDDALGAETVFREGTKRVPKCASSFASLARKLRERNDLRELAKPVLSL